MRLASDFSNKDFLRPHLCRKVTKRCLDSVNTSLCLLTSGNLWHSFITTAPGIKHHLDTNYNLRSMTLVLEFPMLRRNDFPSLLNYRPRWAVATDGRRMSVIFSFFLSVCVCVWERKIIDAHILTGAMLKQWIELCVCERERQKRKGDQKRKDWITLGRRKDRVYPLNHH